MSEQYIQFVANYKDWVSIRKLKIEAATEPKSIMEYLASLGTSIDGKVEENLGKIVNLKEIDNALTELELGKKDTGKALDEINTRKVGGVIKQLVEPLEGLSKPEKKEIIQFCKIYAMKKALKECNLMVDYSGVEIPGMKRTKKKQKG